jgi:glycosyltransferase involved in cell wall biosynthesis
MSSGIIHVLCLVSSLRVGAAEKHTVTLANLLDPQTFDVHLGYLKPMEALKNQVREGIAARTFCLHVRERIDRVAEWIWSAFAIAVNHLNAKRCGRNAVFARAIAVLNLSGSAFITGFKDDVRPYLAICDVVVLASHAIETFWIAALEAMTMGKPLVLTRIGGAEKQVISGKNGFLWPPDWRS